MTLAISDRVAEMRFTDIAIWREQICHDVLKLDFAPFDTGPFCATLNMLLNSDGVKVVHWTHTPGTISRNDTLAEDGSDSISFLLPLNDSTLICQRGKEQEIKAGQGLLLRDCEPGMVASKGGGSLLIMQVDVSVLREHPAIENLVGVKLHGNPPLQMLSAYIYALAEMNERERRTLGSLPSKHLIDLLSSTCEFVAGCSNDHRESIAEARLRIAKIYVDRCYSEPAIDELNVATEQGISVRYLQKLFENEGIPFSEYLNRRRVDAARCMLETNTRELTVIAVALAVGYRDVSHFYRMFKRFTGLTPAEVRYRALRAERER